MKYLKAYNSLFESYETEILETFSGIIRGGKINTIEYTPRSQTFNIYVLYGDRYNMNDHNILKELYDYRDMIKEMYNKDYHFISLVENKVVIVLKDYLDNNRREYYMRHIYMSSLMSKIPNDIYNIINLDANRLPGGLSEIGSGIRYSNGDSGNLALFDWQYRGKEISESSQISCLQDDVKDIKNTIEDILSELYDYDMRRVTANIRDEKACADIHIAIGKSNDIQNMSHWTPFNIDEVSPVVDRLKMYLDSTGWKIGEFEYVWTFEKSKGGMRSYTVSDLPKIGEISNTNTKALVIKFNIKPASESFARKNSLIYYLKEYNDHRHNYSDDTKNTIEDILSVLKDDGYIIGVDEYQHRKKILFGEKGFDYFFHLTIIRNKTSPLDKKELTSTLRHIVSFMFDNGYPSIGIDVSFHPFRSSIRECYSPGEFNESIIDEYVNRIHSGFLQIEIYFGSH